MVMKEIERVLDITTIQNYSPAIAKYADESCELTDLWEDVEEIDKIAFSASTRSTVSAGTTNIERENSRRWYTKEMKARQQGLMKARLSRATTRVSMSQIN